MTSQSHHQVDPKVIVALDFDNKHHALSLVDQLDPSMCKLKVGKEMFTLLGPEFVKTLVNSGYDVFLDLKFHDIPNTVAKACLAAAELGVWMLNVHASGGNVMMETTQQALAKHYGKESPLLIAVTVLTSMDQAQLHSLGIDKTPQQQVMHLAALSREAGMDGVVCSAQEAQMLKSQLGAEFTLVTPGIRPSGVQTNDQKRVMTPSQAITAGVDYMVIGRPITQADSPLQALQNIHAEIATL